MHHASSDLVFAHATIVGMLAIASRWAYQFERRFAFVAIGWISQFVGLAVSLGPLGKADVTVVQECAAVLAGGCFCAAAQDFHRPLARSLVIGCGFGLLLCCVVTFEIVMPGLAALAKHATTLGATTGGVGLVLVCARFDLSYRPLRHAVLLVGVWLYTLVQPIQAFTPRVIWLDEIGILSEGCIAIGIVGYLVAAAEEEGRAAQRKAAANLTATTGRILHEIATPVAQIGED